MADVLAAKAQWEAQTESSLSYTDLLISQSSVTFSITNSASFNGAYSFEKRMRPMTSATS